MEHGKTWTHVQVRAKIFHRIKIIEGFLLK
jgi:hypothetical protein